MPYKSMSFSTMEALAPAASCGTFIGSSIDLEQVQCLKDWYSQAGTGKPSGEACPAPASCPPGHSVRAKLPDACCALRGFCQVLLTNGASSSCPRALLSVSVCCCDDAIEAHGPAHRAYSRAFRKLDAIGLRRIRLALYHTSPCISRLPNAICAQSDNLTVRASTPRARCAHP